MRITDERRIGGFKNRLIVGVNVHNGDDRHPAVRQRAECDEGRPAVALARQVGERLGLRGELVLLPARTSPWWPARSILHAARDRTDLFLSNGNQSGSRDFDIWSPKVGLLWDVDRDLAGVRQRLAQRRGAELRRELASRSIAFSNIKAQTATTYEIGTRGRRPDYTWDLAALPRRDRQRAAVPASARSATARSSMPTAPCIRASRSGFGVTVLQAHLRRTATGPTGSGSTSAYTLNDFHFDDDARFGDNELPGAPRHYPAQRAALQASARGSSSGPTSSGCRRPTTSTAPTR